MHSLFLEGFNIFEFSGGILLGAVSAFIGARWIDPLMEVLYDGIKNNKGVIGKIYKAYSKSLGRLLFLKKRSTHVALKGKIWEYKLSAQNGSAVCYRSKITRLDQNIFSRIQGEMKRISSPTRSNDTYFKGHIKNKNANYLIWEENYRSDGINHHLSSHYILPEREIENISGLTIEERNGMIINNLSILSSNEFGYSSVKDLLNHVPGHEKYLDLLNIEYESIKDESNKIISDTIHTI